MRVSFNKYIGYILLIVLILSLGYIFHSKQTQFHNSLLKQEKFIRDSLNFQLKDIKLSYEKLDSQMKVLDLSIEKKKFTVEQKIIYLNKSNEKIDYTKLSDDSLLKRLQPKN
jgi:hypothetical protein